MLIFYVLQLATIGVTMLVRKVRHVQPQASVQQQNSWQNKLKIASVGILDATTNFVNAFAYGYSDMTSVILLVSLSSPFSMVFGRLILKRRYQAKSVITAITVLIMAFSYTLLDKDTTFNGNSKIVGDLLAILSAVGYAFTSTLNEKFGSTEEYAAYVGILSVGGTATCLILTLALELRHYAEVPTQAWLLMLPYGCLMVCFYLLAIYVTRNMSAVHFNLSSLCTNFYTFAVSFIMGTAMQWLQVLPAIGVVVSALIYFLSSDSEQNDQDDIERHSSTSIRLSE